MSEKTIQTAPNVTVFLERVGGNLQVKGWDRSEVLLKSSAGEAIDLEEREDGLHLKCLDNCLLRLPYAAHLQIGRVGGNVRIKLLDGPLLVDLIAGELVLRNVADTQVNVVQGNVLAKQITGDLNVNTVSGNAVARDIQGDCTVGQAGGNIELRDIEGDISATAGGNLRLRLSLLLGSSYRITAGGNLSCLLPEDANLQINMESGAEDIQIQLSDQSNRLKVGQHSLELGDASDQMELEAGGKIFLGCQEAEWGEISDIQSELEDELSGISEEFGQQISAQIESQIASQLEALEDHIEELENYLGQTGLSPSEIERILARTRAAGDRANVRAQAQIQRAQEKLERKLAAAQRKAELKARAAERRRRTQGTQTWNINWPGPDSPAQPPVSDEERLLILRMLSEKKISLQEAEELLSALEGK